MSASAVETALKLAVFSVSLCSAFGQLPVPQLGGTSWRLVRFQSGDGKAITPDDASKYTVAFGADGTVSVRVDCNRGHGTWKSAGANQIQFGPMALTRAMCPPALLNERIPQDWEHVHSYAIKDGRLFLSLMADRGVYEFEPLNAASQSTEPGANAPLENTDWKLTRLGDAPVPANSRQKRLEFVLHSDTGLVSGSGGCNRLTGNYERNGDRLRFDHMATTMMFCSGAMETEKAFLDALHRVNRWKISGQQLELLNARGHLLARFEAVP